MILGYGKHSNNHLKELIIFTRGKKLTMKNLIFAVSVVCLTFNVYAQNRGTGLLFNSNDYSKIEKQDQPLGFGDNLPSSVSLKKYVPAIGDQGDHGTCVGWSSTYYMASMEYAINAKLSGLSEVSSNTFDPYYTYLSIVDEDSYYNCGDGTYCWRACQHLVANGVKRLSYNTYECGAEIKEDIRESNSIIDFTDYHKIFDRDEDEEYNVNAVKQALSENHPVLIGMNLPRSFYDIGSDGILTTVDGESTVGGHAMTIIGYDDNMLGGCFEIVNSWGEDWGNNGFFYVKYKDYNTYNWSGFYVESQLKETSATTGCVFGDCDNGYGRYVLQDDMVYEGDFVDGSQGGYGVFFWADDSHFGGEWEEGTRHGKGKYVDTDLSTLDGYWKNGTYNGYEVVENSIVDEGGSLERLFTVDSPLEFYDLLKDDTYIVNLEKTNLEECVYGDCEDGFGMYLKSDKYVYIGFFKNGSRAGYGEMTWLQDSKGHIYRGEFKDGSREGNGIYLYPSGNKYYGEWFDGSRHGNGSMFYNDGTNKTGTWEDNKLDDDGFGFGENDEVPLEIIKVNKEKVADKTPLKIK